MLRNAVDYLEEKLAILQQLNGGHMEQLDFVYFTLLTIKKDTF